MNMYLAVDPNLKIFWLFPMNSIAIMPYHGQKRDASFNVVKPVHVSHLYSVCIRTVELSSLSFTLALSRS